MAYHMLAEGLPPGPSSLDDLSLWPEQMLIDYYSKSGAGAAALHRTASLLQHGLVVHSDCSGKLTPEFCLKLFGLAAKVVNLTLPPDWLVLWRCCDSAPACQRFVLNCGNNGPVHMFDSLVGKLGAAAQKHIASLRPAKDDSRDDREASYGAMRDFLVKNKKALFGRDKMSSNCIKHPGSSCRLSWQDPDGIDELSRPLTCCVAGTPCRPFSNMSIAQKLGHSDMEAFYLWVTDASTQSYDFVMLENSDLFMESLFTDGLGNDFDPKFCKFGSQEQGWPTRRSRYYGVGIADSIWACLVSSLVLCANAL